ncbi:uncharacterized protein PHACADRAFT_25982 [Phanerochaete carnosa HHB-10118-sp]|uniref:Uncharacterized protein n=1 Tax=Phanerochaete carnosa (strain HHB-10118-sp) TaxID=650164 RepID=K5VAN8_PHACS|nr:uncharacterized protein PHACADRAFT_25982 [Phanerochaete carnosa HHB-10118-sp]EKM59921.1 hypothetical protein PHACADRAFT_25982 [Phanerochaete carnosa HHB-10118-sp]
MQSDSGLNPFDSSFGRGLWRVHEGCVQYIRAFPPPTRPPRCAAPPAVNTDPFHSKLTSCTHSKSVEGSAMGLRRNAFDARWSARRHGKHGDNGVCRYWTPISERAVTVDPAGWDRPHVDGVAAAVQPSSVSAYSSASAVRDFRHSCQPNTNPVFSDSDESMPVRAAVSTTSDCCQSTELSPMRAPPLNEHSDP